jgi:hypothetical protein
VCSSDLAAAAPATRRARSSSSGESANYVPLMDRSAMARVTWQAEP